MKEEINQLLKEGVVTVTFTKKDGTERVMHCTKSDDRIPQDKKPTGNGEATKNEEVARVFDLEAMEWRSFRFDSVISFQKD